MAEIQKEHAYQKQEGAFLNTKDLLAKKTKRGIRYYKTNIGMGYKTPREAILGDYVDNNCPFTGNVNIRGRILKGMITSVKMNRTVIVRRDYLHYVRKYQRYEKRHTNIPTHCSPCFRVKEGDIAEIGECRPISKTVRFNLLKVKPNKIFGSVKKQFVLF